MLRVQLDDDNVEVRFDHKLCGPSQIESRTGICVEGDRKCSLAEVSLNGDFVAIGMAICNPSDNFCKTIGRKKALTYGVATLSKKLRTAVWDEYKAVCKF